MGSALAKSLNSYYNIFPFVWLFKTYILHEFYSTYIYISEIGITSLRKENCFFSSLCFYWKISRVFWYNSSSVRNWPKKVLLCWNNLFLFNWLDCFIVSDYIQLIYDIKLLRSPDMAASWLHILIILLIKAT